MLFLGSGLLILELWVVIFGLWVSAQSRGVKLDCAPVDPIHVLNSREIAISRAYTSKFFLRDPKKTCAFEDLVIHVGDDPRNRGGWLTWSAANSKLPTMRRTGGLYISLQKNRQVLLREMYLSMGYPTFEVAQRFSHLNALYRVFVPGFSYWDARRADGNSMHVGNVGVFMGTMFLCCQSK